MTERPSKDANDETKRGKRKNKLSAYSIHKPGKSASAFDLKLGSGNSMQFHNGHSVLNKQPRPGHGVHEHGVPGHGIHEHGVDQTLYSELIATDQSTLRTSALQQSVMHQSTMQ